MRPDIAGLLDNLYEEEIPSCNAAGESNVESW